MAKGPEFSVAHAELQEVTGEGGELALDPFSFFAGTASRIGGLGGAAPGHDPFYVFHTPYIEAAEGPARFTVRFHGLTARRGTLQLRVHMLSLEAGARARMINSERIALNRLVQFGGEVTIGFEGFYGVSFALHGAIEDDTDAEAITLSITLDRPMTAGSQDAVKTGMEARSTNYGRDAARPSARLISIDPPSFTAPVSQMATTPQMRETSCAEWRRLLPSSDDGLQIWQDAFVLQALDQYGMLSPGAHGLGLGVEDSPLPAILDARGVKIMGTVLATEDDTGNGFARSANFREMAAGPPPKDMVNFDFVWSIGFCERLESVEGGIGMMLGAMSCLRPGGMAVHCFTFDIHNGQAARSERDMHLLQPRHLERLALTIIARGHEAAQIKVASQKPITEMRSSPGATSGSGSALEVGAFGLIFRRARLPD